MITRQTTFVLGAGFSSEVGMPLGSGLKLAIEGAFATLTANSSVLRDALEQAYPVLRPRLNGAVNRMARALPHAASIDNLVEHFSEDADIGVIAKFCIAHCILGAERASYLSLEDGQPNLRNVRGTAMQGIFSLLVQGVPRHRLEEVFNNVAFVNFNYDRCFELYLSHALRDYSAMEGREAGEIVAGIRHWRPYGHLGEISAPDNLEVGRKGGFGQIPQNQDVSYSANRIRTYSESYNEEDMEEARRWIAGSRQIVFLGCAFHEQNLRIIKPPQPAHRCPIFGTYFREPGKFPNGQGGPPVPEFIEPNRRVIEKSLKKDFTQILEAQTALAPVLRPYSCAQLVDHFDQVWTQP